jgi:hypothetical protein
LIVIRILKGLAAAPVEQSQLGGLPDVREGDKDAAGIGSERLSSFVERDIAAQAIDLECGADARDQFHLLVGNLYLRQELSRHPDTRALLLLFFSPAGNKALRVGLEGNAAAHHLGPVNRIPWTFDRDAEGEAIE